MPDSLPQDVMRGSELVVVIELQLYVRQKGRAGGRGEVLYRLV